MKKRLKKDLLEITQADFFINQIKLHAQRAGLSMAAVARLSGVAESTLLSKRRSLAISPATADKVLRAIWSIQ